MIVDDDTGDDGLQRVADNINPEPRFARYRDVDHARQRQLIGAGRFPEPGPKHRGDLGPVQRVGRPGLWRQK